MTLVFAKAHPTQPPHPEVAARSGALEGGLQFAPSLLEPSFEGAARHLRMRVWVGSQEVGR
jgi:hypothetical protein